MRINVYSPALRICSGAPGLILAAVVWLVCGIIGMHADQAYPDSGSTLLPPASQWGLYFGVLCALGMTGMALTAATLWLLNKRFNLLPGVLYSSLLLVMCGTTPAIVRGLSGAVITGLVILGCTLMLFGLYGRRNATSGCLLLFTTISWGSMVQTPCLWFAIIFIIGLNMMQVMRLRELSASILGLLAPYWIVFGFGWADPARLSPLHSHTIFNLQADPATIVGTLAVAGFTALTLIIIMLYNAINTPSAGVRIRSCHSFVNLLGFASLLLMILDAGRLPVYLMTAFISLSLMTTRCTYQSRSPRAWILPVSIAAIYILIFALTPSKI